MDVRAAVARGETLPWSWYVDPDVLQREQRRIFRRTWQYAGRLDQAREPGDRFPARAGDVPVVVVRDDEGRLRAFVNVCRHRGAVLVDEPGRARTLQCPYHAWTYGLDGRLRSAPRLDREGGIDLGDVALVAAAVDTWGPFVFVNVDPAAAPLADTLGELPARLAASGLDLDALAFHHREEWHVEANWKIGVENYLECYHCAVAHPGFSAVVDVDPDAYRIEADRWFSSQIGPLRATPRARFDPYGEVHRSQFHFLWPNLALNVSPGRPNLSIGPFVPTGPQRTFRSLDYFFASDADAGWIEELLAWDTQVGREDEALVARVQRGVAAEIVPHGHVLPRSEHLVAHFDALVAEALA